MHMYYYQSGNRVDMVPSSRAFTVTCKPGATPQIVAALEAGGIEVLASEHGNGLIGVLADGGKAAIEKALDLDAIMEMPEIDAAYVLEGGGDRAARSITRRIGVRFPEHFDRAAVDAACERQGVEVVEPIKGMRGGYILRVTIPNPINIARALVEDEGAVDAEPDFIVRMVNRGNWLRT